MFADSTMQLELTLQYASIDMIHMIHLIHLIHMIHMM